MGRERHTETLKGNLPMCWHLESSLKKTEIDMWSPKHRWPSRERRQQKQRPRSEEEGGEHDGNAGDPKPFARR